MYDSLVESNQSGIRKGARTPTAPPGHWLAPGHLTRSAQSNHQVPTQATGGLMYSEIFISRNSEGGSPLYQELIHSFFVAFREPLIQGNRTSSIPGRCRRG
jgi:hypothetical protein